MHLFFTFFKKSKAEVVSIEAEQIAGDLDKDECDELNNPEWKNQKKHIFVLSEAGKPIYSRYCVFCFL